MTVYRILIQWMHITTHGGRPAITFWKGKRLSKGLNFKIKWRKKLNSSWHRIFPILGLNIGLIPARKNISFRYKSVCKILFEMTYPHPNNFFGTGNVTWSVFHCLFAAQTRAAIFDWALPPGSPIKRQNGGRISRKALRVLLPLQCQSNSFHS